MTLRFLSVLWAASVISAAGAELSSSAGITEPILDATLSSPVAGILVSHKFKEGEFVKKDQPIIELDRRQEELEANRRAVVLPSLLADAEGTRSLFRQTNSSVSKEMVDKKQADYDVARLEHELAEELVRKRLIVAPFDGYVAEIFLKVGEACQIQQPVVRLVDTRRCVFVSNLDGKLGQGLKVGQKIDLQIDAGAEPVRFTGTISFISPVVDPASGLLKVKVLFENPDNKIRPGVAGKMFFEEGKNARP